MGVATFNWAYGPTTNPHLRPTGWVYVSSNAGNDTHGNGSRKYPYRTITKALTVSEQCTIVLNGYFREIVAVAANKGHYWQGDGFAMISGYSLSGTFNFGLNGGSSITYTFKNIRLEYASLSTAAVSAMVFSDCYFQNCSQLYNNNQNLEVSTFLRCVIDGCNFGAQGSGGSTPQNYLQNCTVIRSYVPVRSPAFSNFKNNIFYQCNIDILNTTNYTLDFNLYYQCNVRINTAGTQSVSTTYYPSLPSGYELISSIEGLRTKVTTAYGGSNVLPYSAVTDPLFVNYAIKDFALAFNSPARNMTFQGGYIGARSVMKPGKISNSAATSFLSLSSAVNFTIGDDSMVLTDKSQNGSVLSLVFINSEGRTILKFPITGTNADRNGQITDATTDLAATTKSPSDTLDADAVYQVEIGSIVYNSNTYTVGQRFTVVSGVTSFTTSTDGVLREIIEVPARENIEARFSDGDVGLTASGDIGNGHFYVVEGASVEYDSVTYAAGTSFMGTATTTYTGTGNVRKVFNSGDSFQYFEINQQPTTNNTGNVKTGAIVRGNGDKDFDRTPANIFTVNKKYIQLRLTIQAKNAATQ